MSIIIDNIIVGPMGKIKAIKLQGMRDLVNKEEVIKLVKQYPDMYRNFNINEQGNFVIKGSNLAYNSKGYPIIVYEKGMLFGTVNKNRVEGFEPSDVTSYSKYELDFSVYKAICEKINIGSRQYNLILKIQFICNTPQSIRIFKDLGAAQISENIFELSQVQIHRLMNTCKLLNNLVSNNYILEVKYTEYLHYNGNIHYMEYDDSNRVKLQKWMEKAKILGILHNYTIDIEQSALVECKCNDGNLILPPVRRIRTGCFYGVYDEKVVIPDTVMGMDEELGKIKGLKSLILGENLISCPNLFTQDIKNLEYINFNNVSRLYISRCFSNLYEAQLKLSSRMIRGGLFTSDTDVFVELIED